MLIANGSKIPHADVLVLVSQMRVAIVVECLNCAGVRVGIEKVLGTALGCEIVVVAVVLRHANVPRPSGNDCRGHTSSAQSKVEVNTAIFHWNVHCGRTRDKGLCASVEELPYYVRLTVLASVCPANGRRSTSLDSDNAESVCQTLRRSRGTLAHSSGNTVDNFSDLSLDSDGASYGKSVEV